jgi:hypothetical protein
MMVHSVVDVRNGGLGVIHLLVSRLILEPKSASVLPSEYTFSPKASSN